MALPLIVAKGYGGKKGGKKSPKKGTGKR